MIGSGVHAGEFELAYAHGRSDRDGLSLGDELVRIGYRGETRCGEHELAAHFELHIEQGPILENEGIQIGVLTGVQGIRWYELIVRGAETHAGPPSPMASRRDPVPVMADIIPRVYGIAAEAGEDARCTVGIVHAEPGSPNTVPGNVRATVDFRHPRAAVTRPYGRAVTVVGPGLRGKPLRGSAHRNLAFAAGGVREVMRGRRDSGGGYLRRHGEGNGQRRWTRLRLRVPAWRPPE